MADWIIIEGITADGKEKEFQVSDGEQGNRSESYDFLSYQDAKDCCDELNGLVKDKYQSIGSNNADYFVLEENEDE